MVKKKPTANDDVTAGQVWSPPEAALHNAWNDAAIYAQTQGAAPVEPEVPTVQLETSRSDVLIQATNTVAPASVIGWGDPVTPATDSTEAFQEPVLAAGTPETNKWVIARAGIREGDIGACTIQGLAWAQVVIENTSHEYAEVNQSGVLASAEAGYGKILYSPGSVGSQWCLLLLGCCGGAAEPGELSPLPCTCFDFAGNPDTFCRVYLEFGDVGVYDNADPPPGNYPDICEPGTLVLPGQCTSCVNWNKKWELFKEVTSVPTDCRFGVEQIGSQIPEPFPATAQFPCDSYGDASMLYIVFNCDDPADGTGRASARLQVRGTPLFDFDFDEIFFDANYNPGPSDLTNRAVRYTLIGGKLGQAWCAISTTRDPGSPNNQGSFNPVTGTPNLQDGTGNQNDFYVVLLDGTWDFSGTGDPDRTFDLEINDIVSYWAAPENKWFVIPNSGGATPDDTYLPGNINFAIDRDGCDWTDMINNMEAVVKFDACP